VALVPQLRQVVQRDRRPNHTLQRLPVGVSHPSGSRSRPASHRPAALTFASRATAARCRSLAAGSRERCVAASCVCAAALQRVLAQVLHGLLARRQRAHRARARVHRRPRSTVSERAGTADAFSVVSLVTRPPWPIASGSHAAACAHSPAAAAAINYAPIDCARTNEWNGLNRSGFDPTKNSVFFRCHECASELERKQREEAERYPVAPLCRYLSAAAAKHNAPKRCGCPLPPSGGFAKALRLPSESAAESVGLGAKTPLGPSLARQVRLSGGLRPLLGPGRAAARTMPRGPMHAARALWWAGCGSSPSSEDSKRSGAPSIA
jgi:hypothetical protein